MDFTGDWGQWRSFLPTHCRQKADINISLIGITMMMMMMMCEVMKNFPEFSSEFVPETH